MVMKSGEDFPIPDEQYRIEHYRSGEVPLLNYEYIVVAHEAGSDCVEKVREVIALIAPFNLDMDNCPPDDYWRQTLPEWLRDNLRDDSEQVQGHIRWHFGSWVWSMMEREWQWWSIATNDTQFTLYFTIQGWPYSIGALRELIHIAGGRVIYEF
jgi:hypothetical protein